MPFESGKHWDCFLNAWCTEDFRLFNYQPSGFPGYQIKNSWISEVLIHTRNDGQQPFTSNHFLEVLVCKISPF